MKTSILTHTIAALLLAAPVARADEKKEAGNAAKANASTSVVTSSDGTATLTIDINGKKETRTFKLGDGNTTLPWNAAGNSVRDFSLMKSSGKTNAKTERGAWLGIGMDPVQEVVRAQLPLAPGEGVVVSHVMADSPAQKAGLAENDILVRFDEQIIVEPAQVRKLIAMQKTGNTVKLIYLRKGERKEASVTLAEHEIEVGEMNPARWFQNAQGLWSPSPAMNDRLEHMQDQVKHWKEMVPGVIVDKHSWFSGGGREQFKGMLDNVRKQLDDSNLSQEEKEKIRKGVEQAIETARKAIDGAVKESGHPKKDGEKKNDELSKPAEKKPGESF